MVLDFIKVKCYTLNKSTINLTVSIIVNKGDKHGCKKNG